MRNKTLALLTVAVLTAMLAGCGSNRSSDGSSSGTSVTAAKVGSSSCQVCHTAIVDQGWVGSVHDDDADAGCEGCHGGGQFHKGIGEIPTAEPGIEECAECHESADPGFLTRHSEDLTTTSYTTTPSTPTIEGYVNVEDCLGCHVANSSDATQWQHDPKETDINRQWAQSGHAGKIASSSPDTETVWGHYDWDATNRQSCQRCHTATGAKNFLSAPTTYSTKKNDFSHLTGWVGTKNSSNEFTSATVSGQNELLFCWACHSELRTGTLRNPGAITETYTAATTGDPATTVTYPDINESNVCMACHLGRETGQVIKNNVDADGVRSFINSHYLTAGATLFSESGYEYAGKTYSAGFHKGVGLTDLQGTGTDGPCVACHMSGVETHTFEVVEKDTDGTITGIASTACDNCHATMSAELLEGKKAEFEEALGALKDALEAKGIYYGEAHPYFYTATYVAGGSNTAFTNWAGVYDLARWKDVMGAAFNYNLFKHDPGAYAHNRAYALELIRDSIDFLGDGSVDGDTNVAAEMLARGINVGSEAGYADIHDSAVPAPSALVCGTCHSAAPHYGGTVLVQAQFVGQATTYDAAGASCSRCHAGGDVSANAEIIAQYAESGHGDNTGIAWWDYDWRASNRASCARCHNGTAFIAKLGNESNTTWIYTAGDTGKPGETLGCVSCHTDISTGARRAASAFTATWTANNVTASVSFPDVGDSNLCVRCHSSRRGGVNITDVATTTAHYLPIAASLFSGTADFVTITANTSGSGPVVGTKYSGVGYEFAGQDYTNLGPHKTVGVTDGAGPCVFCHMSGDAGHTWVPGEKDDNGDFTAITSSACSNIACHGSGMDADELNDQKDAFQVYLDGLEAQLEAKGFYFNPENGSFYKESSLTNAVNNAYFTAQAATFGLTAANLEGATFNYWLYSYKGGDPCGYVHNPDYAKKLLNDSRDYLNDGLLNGN